MGPEIPGLEIHSMARHPFWQIITAPTTLLGVGIIAALIALVQPPAPEGRELAWPFRPDCCGSIDTLAFSADGTALTAAGNSGGIVTWDVETGEARDFTRLAPAYGLSHALAAEGKMVAAVAWDNGVMIRDLEGSSSPGVIPSSGRLISAVAFSPDSKTLAEGDLDGIVTLRDVASDRAIGTFRGARSGVVRLAFSPDGTVLAAGDRDGTATLWDTASGEIKAILERDPTTRGMASVPR